MNGIPASSGSTRPFDTFNKLVNDQFAYGGQKYARTAEKEATDCLFDAHGPSWLFGTIDKYTYRFRNLARERDLLKIATYMFILWLKRGFHLSASGSSVPINTTVDIKTGNFDKFIGLAETDESILYRLQDPITAISEQMVLFSEQGFLQVREDSLIAVYNACFNLWFDKYGSNPGQDTDTFNESKK